MLQIIGMGIAILLLFGFPFVVGKSAGSNRDGLLVISIVPLMSIAISMALRVAELIREGGERPSAEELVGSWGVKLAGVVLLCALPAYGLGRMAHRSDFPEFEDLPPGDQPPRFCAGCGRAIPLDGPPKCWVCSQSRNWHPLTKDRQIFH